METGQAAPAAAPAQPQPRTSQDQRGVPDPVLRIQAILDSERPAEQAPTTQQPAAPQQPATEQVSEPTEAQPEADAPAEPNKQVEGEEAPTEDARQTAEIPLDQLEAIELETTYKVEDGKDVTEKLSVKALREGYMRQKDYQRKTAELARQRESEAETRRQAIEGERTAYQKNLQQLQALLLETAAPELKDVNWNDLAANNPFEYVRLRNRADQILQALSTIQGKQKELTAKQQAEQDAMKQKVIAKAQAELQDGIPGWNDNLYQTLMKAGDKYGYKPEEVATWADSRAIKLLHKAYLYDQMQSEKSAPAAAKKVVVAPKVVKPGTPQATSQRQQKEQGAMKQLRTSGKLEDAAAVIRSRLG